MQLLRAKDAYREYTHDSDCSMKQPTTRDSDMLTTRNHIKTWMAEVATAYVSCPAVWYPPHAESQLQAETSEKHTGAQVRSQLQG